MYFFKYTICFSIQRRGVVLLGTSSTFKDLSGGFLKLGSVGKDNTNTDESTWDEGFSVTHNVAHTQAIEYGMIIIITIKLRHRALKSRFH